MRRNEPLKLAIDGRYLSHNLVGGVRTYIENLSRALLQIQDGLQLTFWIDSKAAFDLDPLPSDVTVRCLNWRSGFSSIRNDLRIGRQMKHDGADVAHFPANYGLAPPTLPRVITIHDAINLLPLKDIIAGHSHRPGTIATMTYLHQMTRCSSVRGPDVVTVSEYSRQEILKHSSLDPQRVFVVPSAHDPAFAPALPKAVEELRHQLRLRKRVLLADAIKNPDCVLRAFQALPDEVRRDTSLLFFSRRTPPDSVQRSSQSGESTVLLRPSRDELVVMFTLADVFVFPSWYEGFGLPILESMACGTPVIASDRGSIPEVLGEHGLTVDADDHLAVSAIARRLLSDRQYHSRLSELAIDRASKFSWQRAASQMHGIYREAFDRSHVAPQWKVTTLDVR